MLESVQKIIDLLEGHRPVFLFSVDPGSFAVMSPIYDGLRDAGRSEAEWVLDGWAKANKASCVSYVLPSQLEDRLRQEVARGTPCVLLGSRRDFTATHAAIRLCAAIGVSTMFVFDHWANHLNHFIGEDAVHLPDAICTIDVATRTKLLTDLELRGLTPTVHVVGHPGIERDLDEIQHLSDEHVRRLRARWCEDTKRLALLILEPVESDFAHDPIGYTEYSVIDRVLKHLDPTDSTLLIRPHPRHSVPVVTARVAATVPREQTWTVSDAATLPEMIAAADEVYGMTSPALLVAAQADKPVTSVQPGRTEAAMQLSHPFFERHLML